MTIDRSRYEGHSEGPIQIRVDFDETDYPHYIVCGLAGDAKRDTDMHAANAALFSSAPLLLAELDRLEAENAKQQQTIATLTAERDRLDALCDQLRDDAINKVMAATDTQIDAMCRLEGRSPDDVAALGGQAVKLAMLTAERDRARQALRDLEWAVSRLPFVDDFIADKSPPIGCVKEFVADAVLAARTILSEPAKG